MRVATDYDVRHYFFYFIGSTFVVIESVRFEVMGGTIKPVMFLLAVIVFLYALKILMRGSFILPPFAGFLAVYWFSGWLAYICNRVVSMNDFTWTILGQLFLIAVYLALYEYLAKNHQKIKLIIMALINLGLLAFFIGLLQLISYEVFHSTIGISHVDSLGFPRVRSVFSEPDWFGLYMGYCFLLSFVLNGTRRNLYMGVFLLGIFLSGTRAPILSLVVIFFVWLFVNKDFSYRFKLAFLVGGVTVILVIFAMLPNTLQQRYNPFTSISSDSGAADTRIYTMQLSYDYFLANPIVGNGMGSLGDLTRRIENSKKYASGGDLNTGRGGANILMTTLFDVGVIGAVPFFLFLLLLIRGSIKSMQKDSISNVLSAGMLFFVIECMVNNIFRYTLFWLHLALFSAYCRYFFKKKLRIFSQG